MSMLITNLGNTRRKLLASLRKLTDEQLNAKPRGAPRSIAEIVYHLHVAEKGIATTIFDAMHADSEKVDERGPSSLADHVRAHDVIEPHAEPLTKQRLIELLEESRFRDLQLVFNKTHERVLVDKSMQHPSLGQISLKNLMDYVWVHELHHVEQIEAIEKAVI